MMPVSPCTPAPTLPFSAINHYTTSPSKSVTFDSLPVLRGEHSSYCSFNNISHHDGFYKDEELNDSDSETYWRKGESDKCINTRCVLKIIHHEFGRAEWDTSPHRSLKSPHPTPSSPPPPESEQVREEVQQAGQRSSPPHPALGVLSTNTGPQWPLLYQHGLLEC